MTREARPVSKIGAANRRSGLRRLRPDVGSKSRPTTKLSGISRVAVAAAILFATPPAFAQRRDPNLPEFPFGVSVPEEIPAVAELPSGASAYMVEVDWTSAWLRARLEVGVAAGPGGSPARWDRVAPDALKIQLVEPAPDAATDGWTLPLAASPAEEAARIDPDASDLVWIGGAAPWFPSGPRVAADPEPGCRLFEGAGVAATRWLGRPDDWLAAPPAESIRSLALLSILDPYDARTRFVLVANRGGGDLPLAELGKWLKAAWPADSWIALHAVGDDARIGLGDWRLGASDFALPVSRVERVGAVLVLEAVRPGEPIDWVRAGGAAIVSSASDHYHSREELFGARLWPTPLDPPGWVDPVAGDEKGEGPAWIEFALDPPRVLDAIEIFQASAAGWSRDFNSPKIRIRLTRAGRRDPDPPVEVETGGREILRANLRENDAASAVRIELDRAPATAEGSPARVAAVRLKGPWDGTPPDPYAAVEFRDR